MSNSPMQQARLRSWARAGAYLVLVMTLIVLVLGWGFDLTTLRSPLSGTVEVKPSTAFALSLAGISILLLVNVSPAAWQTRTGQVLAFAVLVIGLVFLAEFLLDWNPGIDEFPFRDATGQLEGVSFPGRLAPATAVNLVLTGLALLTLDVHMKGRWRLGEVLTLPIVVIAAMAMIAYMYSIPSFYAPDASTKMAVTTSVCFIILAFSIVFMCAQGRLVTILSTDAPGGVLARRLAPVLILLPLLLGWARLEAAEAGTVTNRIGTWWFTAAAILISLLVLGWIVSKLNDVDDERREMEQRLHDQANLDRVTGLWNRRRFRQELAGHASRTRRHADSTAVISIGLDGLRGVDERHGRATSNAVLEQIGESILRTIKVGDVAGRLTGDEFAILLPGSSAEGANIVAEKLRNVIGSLGTGGGDELEEMSVSVSVGVKYTAAPLVDNGHKVLFLANEGMAEARRRAGDRAVVDPSPNDRKVAIPLPDGDPSGSPRGSKRSARTGSRGQRIMWFQWVPYATSITAALALGVLVWDHFQRLGTVVVGLATPVLVAAIASSFFLFRSVSHSRRHLKTFERMRMETAEASSDGLVTIDGGGTILEWNPVSARIFNCARNEAVGRNLGEFIGPTSWQESRRRGVAALTGSGAEPVLDQVMELTAISTSGETFPIDMTLIPLRLDPPKFIASIRDTSERSLRNEEMERLAAIVRSSEDAIYSKDLNGVVTAWNEGAEKLFGFTAVEAIGQSLTNLTVPEDRVEEVQSIIRKAENGESVAMVTQRRTKSGKMSEVSLRSFPIHDLRGEVIGISVSAHDRTERVRMEKQEARSAERALWNQRIKDALENDAFLLFGQPVVHVRSGDTHHHELLIRMELEGTVVSPYKFLPHAEASGLITEIDRWVIRRGIEYGAVTPVAINLSGRSLSVPGLSDFVADTLAEVGTDPANVQFEVTETAAAENLADARRLVGDLTDLGCGSSIDDFGTGYGTFTYLKYLPVTELKIDVTFIQDLKDEMGYRVVSSIIAVAQSFEMTTVAEGVEDAETLQMLNPMGVDLAQGYHIGRPQPMDSILEKQLSMQAHIAKGGGNE